ncbi:MAG: hypothetical protein R2735_02985 [Microthrixaceae bacterium]
MSTNKFWDHALLNVDAKGRISVPVATRELFDDNGGFLVWMDDRIALMLPKTWDRYYSSFQRDESVSPRQLELLAARAATCKIDPQGRLVLSQRLRDMAGINGQVQMVPASSHALLYAPEVWEAVSAADSADQIALSERMSRTRVL